MIRNRKTVIALIACVIFCIFSYVHLVLWPWKLDYHLRGRFYNEIMRLLLSPWYETILFVDNRMIVFHDNTECYSNKKYGSPVCNKKYDELFNLVYWSNIKSASAWKGVGAIYHGSLISGYKEIDYFYNKQGFSEKEKRKWGVREVMNDNWIVVNH